MFTVLIQKTFDLQNLSTTDAKLRLRKHKRLNKPMLAWPAVSHQKKQAEKGDEILLRFFFWDAKLITEGFHHSLWVHKIQ